MKNQRHILKQVRGTTLLEMLIALAITGVVTVAIFKAYITQHHHYIAQEDVTDIQQNARAAIDELTRHVRMAGYDLPDVLAAITPSNTNPDTIALTFHSGGCQTTLSSAMSHPSAVLECGSDISCFQPGQWVYIYEAAVGIGEWFEITQVQTAAFQLQHNTMQLSRAYDEDSEILAMTQAKFFIDTSNSNHPNLMIQYMGQAPQVYAMNISDLQFQYRMKNNMLLDNPIIIDDIREVLVSITGRSNSTDTTVQDTSAAYRFPNYATSVHLRNLGN